MKILKKFDVVEPIAWMAWVGLFYGVLVLSAQATRGVFTYEKTTSLSGAAETVTIHLASNSNRTAKMLAATVYCSVACTATLSRDGTAPTGTAGTVVQLNSTSESSGVQIYHTSDVGAGTTIKTYTLAAGEEKVIDLYEKGITAGKNLTLATNSITGTARIFFQWREY